MEKVKLRSLTLEDGEGRHGFETFSIKDGVVSVPAEVAQSMLQDQPGLWAPYEDKKAKAALTRSKKEAKTESAETADLMVNQEEQLGGGGEVS